jgi:Rps23 Pro-64 3,4-dihydroxylase Tpa1-like proline 4-hydroxylase|tara:strand:+ start:1826 stop:2737 length:912 start_codon:yes stop_codon:yes gene_type:complete
MLNISSQKEEVPYQENLKKLNLNYLKLVEENEDSLNYLGDWKHDVEDLAKKFRRARPYESVVIDNFLNKEYANKIYDTFPSDFENWHKYENPIEVKYALDKIDLLSEDIQKYFYLLSSKPVRNLISNISGVNDLECDEYLHGAGLHAHPRHGRLNIHLDYEKHPHSGKERRINIILFMSKNWKKEWNGANELWNSTVTKCIKKTDVKFNRAIIFKTNDVSWHGLPEKLLCPENTYRKSIAYYYVTPLLYSKKSEDDYRKKATFMKRPSDLYDAGINQLYKIRPFRRITNDDLVKHVPLWTKES